MAAAVLAAEPGVVLPDGAAGPHRLAGRAEQEVGRRRGRRRVTGSSIVMPSDGSSIMSAAAGLTKVSFPSASMAQTPSPMLSVIEESRLALDADLLVQLGVAERAAAHGGQGLQQARGRRRRRARRAAGRPPTSHCGWPATVMAAASSPAAGAGRVRAASGLRSSRRTDSRMVSSTGLLPQPPVGLQRDLVQPLHPGPVIQRREPGADQPALQDQARDRQRQRPRGGPGWPGPGPRRPALPRRPA